MPIKVTSRQQELLQHLKGTYGRSIQSWMRAQTIASCINNGWIFVDYSKNSIKLRLSKCGILMADYEYDPRRYFETLESIRPIKHGNITQKKQKSSKRA